MGVSRGRARARGGANAPLEFENDDVISCSAVKYPNEGGTVTQKSKRDDTADSFEPFIIHQDVCLASWPTVD